MKKHYRVGVRETHVRFYTVDADNEEHAKDLVGQRAPEATDLEELEYANEMPQDTWSVEEVPDKEPPKEGCES